MNYEMFLITNIFYRVSKNMKRARGHFWRKQTSENWCIKMFIGKISMSTLRNIFSEAIKSHQDFALLCIAFYPTHTLYCFFLTTPQLFPSRRITHKNMFQLLISNEGEENIKFPESIFLTALSVFLSLEINIQKLLAFCYEKGITLSQGWTTFFGFWRLKVNYKNDLFVVKNSIVSEKNVLYSSRQFNYLPLQYCNTSWRFKEVHSNCAENLSR